MGNCIFVEEKPIRVMKTDGKILEYKSPTKVFQVLSDFSAGHAISDAVPVTHHLQQATNLLSGHLYFLVPTADPEKTPKKKAVRFAEEPEKEDGGAGRVVRIKVVVTKKELQEMVERGGITAEEMICKMKSGSCEEIISCREFEEDDDEELQKWKPVLQSIPESEVALAC